MIISNSTHVIIIYLNTSMTLSARGAPSLTEADLHNPNASLGKGVSRKPGSSRQQRRNGMHPPTKRKREKKEREKDNTRGGRDRQRKKERETERRDQYEEPHTWTGTRETEQKHGGGVWSTEAVRN